MSPVVERATLGRRAAAEAFGTAPILTFPPISGARFNPAVALARSAGDTFAGIRPVAAPGSRGRA